MKKLVCFLIALVNCLLYAEADTEYYVVKSISIDGVRWDYSITDAKVEIHGCDAEEEVTIPSYIEGKPVVAIMAGAFLNKRLLSVEFPETIREIGSLAFGMCQCMSAIHLPSSLKKIEGLAFFGCSSLEHIDLPVGVEIVGSRAFASCDKLMDVNIPSSVTNIGMAAFAECSSLNCIEVSRDNTFFASSVDGCLYSKDYKTLLCFPTALDRIDISAQTTEIGPYAFTGCQFIEEVVIPSGVKRISENAICGCDKLTQVEISATVNEIEIPFVSDCLSLTNIIVENGNEKFSSQEGLLFSNGGKNLICCPEGLSIARLSALVEEIQPDSLGGSLREIWVNPNNSKYISNEGVLYSKDGQELIRCPPMKTSVMLLATTTNICCKAFEGCASIVKMDLPLGVATIDEFAFNGCAGLSDLNIPTSIVNIADNAFVGCNAVTSLTVSVDWLSAVLPGMYNVEQVRLLDGKANIKEGAFSCKTKSNQYKYHHL